jgi:hypothetical protein
MVGLVGLKKLPRSSESAADRMRGVRSIFRIPPNIKWITGEHGRYRHFATRQGLVSKGEEYGS